MSDKEGSPKRKAKELGGEHEAEYQQKSPIPKRQRTALDNRLSALHDESKSSVEDKPDENSIQGSLSSTSKQELGKLLTKQHQRKEKEATTKRDNKIVRDRKMMEKMEKEIEMLKNEKQKQAQAAASSSQDNSMEVEETKPATSSKSDGFDDDEWEAEDKPQVDNSFDDVEYEAMINAYESQPVETQEEQETTQEEPDKSTPSNGIEITLSSGVASASTDAQEPEDKKQKKPRKKSTTPRKTKYEKQLDLEIHKTCMLVPLAFAVHKNKVANDETLQAVLYSIIPQTIHASCNFKDTVTTIIDDENGDDFSTVEDREPGYYNIRGVLQWFFSYFEIRTDEKSSNDPMKAEQLLKSVSSKILNRSEAELVCVAAFRSLGFTVRFVSVLDSYINLQEKSASVAKKSKAKKETSPKKKKEKAPAKKKSKAISSIDDLEEELATPKARRTKSTKKSPPSKKQEKKIKTVNEEASSSQNDGQTGRKIDLSQERFWIEVFAPAEKQWIKLEVVTNTTAGKKKSAVLNATMYMNILGEAPSHINKVEEDLCKMPYFILGMYSDNTLQDVTLRYRAVNPNASTIIAQEQFADVEQWMESTIRRYNNSRPSISANNHVERKVVQQEAALFEKFRNQRKKRFPTNQEAYKKHPEYCLEKWLNKYEALYPEQPPVLAYLKVKGENSNAVLDLILADDSDNITLTEEESKTKLIPIYSRTCVHILHTRERWLKEGKQVIDGVKPYKIVKSSKLSNSAAQSELFGAWQCKDYETPIAVDGKVPKNERGQVDLFHPKMLPVGCVQLKNLPGIVRICKKLSIDYAPCMTGFEVRYKRSVPVFEGVIVCKEYEQILKDAYLEDEQNRYQKLRKKIETRVYSNWRKLILGVLSRERIMARYGSVLENKESGSASTSTQETTPKKDDENDDDDESGQRKMENGYVANVEKI